jgi:hypothetical protein
VEALFPRRRDIRACLRAGASLLPDLLFAPAGGPGYFLTWLGEVAGPSLGINPIGAPFAFWDGANVLNHSLRGAVALNVDETHHRTLFEAALASADGCFMVIVGTLLAVSPRRPHRSRSTARSCSSPC